MNELETEIYNLRKDLIKKYKSNEDHLIYLRLSSLDTTQDNPIKDALNKLKSDFNIILEQNEHLNKTGFTLFVEIASAYKNNNRFEFEDLYTNYLFKDISINDILESKVSLNHKHLYVSAYDRISRVFLFSLSFLLVCKTLSVNIHSLKSNENALEQEYQDIIQKDNQQQLLYLFQMMLHSSSASRHSEDLSIKTKKRISKNEDGVTISNKTGKKWGLSKSIPDKVVDKIIEYKSLGYDYSFISNQKDIYKINSKTKKKEKISISSIKKEWLNHKKENN